MSKEAVIQFKISEIYRLEKDLETINKLELKRLYKIEHKYTGYQDTYGYPECFNEGSVRFCILASDHTRFGTKWTKGRTNIMSFYYTDLMETLTPVKKADLTLLLGLKYKFPELEKALKGKGCKVLP